MKVNLDTLEKELPALVPRCRIKELTGGLFSAQYMAQLELKKAGPKSFLCGKKVVYRREDFIEWMQDRSVMNQKRK